MKLDVIRAVMAMGFPDESVRPVLRRKLEQTSLPFFSIEPCIEAVWQYIEEATQQSLQEEQPSGQEQERMHTAQEPTQGFTTNATPTLTSSVPSAPAPVDDDMEVEVPAPANYQGSPQGSCQLATIEMAPNTPSLDQDQDQVPAGKVSTSSLLRIQSAVPKRSGELLRYYII